ncbi:hypothetical protein ACIPSJ_27290 [Streptomyces sp. NPDC090088]|uniref:hypothetical protein n=1 Tax=Streptomyces sp. NPDC090088 TaxID=3365944 RepID=UPI00381CCD93
MREFIHPGVFATRQPTATQADNLYELVSERQGRSLIVISNQRPSNWYPPFPDSADSESPLDRLINTSHQAMNGPGYRPNKHPRTVGDTVTPVSFGLNSVRPEY